MAKKVILLKKRRALLSGFCGFLAVIFLGFSLSACEKEAAQKKSIRIGMAGPMTGDQSKIGGDVARGAQLAVDEWNEKGGVLGLEVVLEVGDDQHDPKQAVSVANKMVNLGIVGMVGHFNSSASIPASSVYDAAGIPMITPASTNPRLTEQGFERVFRVVGRDDQQGEVAANFIVNQLKARRVAILHDKTTYGQGLASEVKKSLEAYKSAGLEVVSFDGLTQGDKDFRGILTRLKGQKLDLFYFGGVFPEGGLLVKQAKEVGLSVPMMSGDGVIDPKFIEVAGASAEGTYLTFTPDITELPAAAGFLKNYHAKYGDALAPYAVYAYDAANLLLQSIEKTGSTEGEALANTIRSIEYDGATGHIEFDEKGDIKESPYIVWITQGGRFVPHWTPSDPQS